MHTEGSTIINMLFNKGVYDVCFVNTRILMCMEKDSMYYVIHMYTLRPFCIYTMSPLLLLNIENYMMVEY